MSLRGGCSPRRSNLQQCGDCFVAKNAPRNDVINFQQSHLLPKQDHFEARTRTRWYPIQKEWSAVGGRGCRLNFAQPLGFHFVCSCFSPFVICHWRGDCFAQDPLAMTCYPSITPKSLCTACVPSVVAMINLLIALMYALALATIMSVSAP